MADAQTGGRGRRGRAWTSPPGKGLYLSLILRPSIEPSQVPHLTILAALAAAQGIESECGVTVKTKWPNDILMNRHKIGGILTEADFASGIVKSVIVGIGLNINQTVDELPLRPIFPASSLLLETGREWPLPRITEVWIAEFSALYHHYERGGWPRLRDEFQRRCLGLGEPVTVTTETGKYYGLAARLDEDGILIVQTSNGPRRVIAGDVSFVIHHKDTKDTKASQRGEEERPLAGKQGNLEIRSSFLVLIRRNVFFSPRPALFLFPTSCQSLFFVKPSCLLCLCGESN